MGDDNQVDFRTSAYFPGSIIFFGVLILLTGIFMAKIHVLATLPFFLVSFIIFTTYNGLELDVHRKVYRQYVWLLGLKWGEREAFETIQYIFIKRNMVSQTIHSRITSSTIHLEMYDGVLRFSEKDKIKLATSRNKEDLLKKIKPLARKLQLNILDYSEGTPIVIPMS